MLLRFGVLMMRAGGTGARTHDLMSTLACRFNLQDFAAGISLENVIVSAQRSGEWTTAMKNIGPIGINSHRIGQLERLLDSDERTLSPEEISRRLSEIESAPLLYGHLQLAGAIAIASGGFAFLNGAPMPELIVASASGGIGQYARHRLSRQRLNHFGVAAISATAAAGVYILMTTLADRIGVSFSYHPAGFIASVLFLVPGFPLIAALFDLLHHQATAAVGRFAYGLMMLLAVTFGVSIVIAIAGIAASVPPPPPLDVAYPVKLLLRGVASFVAAFAFAMLFNNAVRMACAAGLVAVIANGLRLLCLDTGMMPAPAAFIAAVTIGLIALQSDQRFNVPRVAIIAPAIVIMVPGLYAYEMIVFLYQSRSLDALQAFASCSFVIGALALGLTTVRLFSRT